MTGLGAVGVGWLAAAGLLPASALTASMPGLVIALVIAGRPPQPARLRTVGWTLVAVSLLTSAILVVGQ